MVEPCPFICLPFAFNLPFIPFRGSFRLSFCPSRFRTFDSQRLMTAAIPATVAFILVQSLALSSCLTLTFPPLSVAQLSRLHPSTSIVTDVRWHALSFFSIIRPMFADSSLRFVLSPSVLPPLLCPLSEAQPFFSDTPRG